VHRRRRERREPNPTKTLAFLSSGAPEAEEARERLVAKYGAVARRRRIASSRSAATA